MWELFGILWVYLGFPHRVDSGLLEDIVGLVHTATGAAC